MQLRFKSGVAPHRLSGAVSRLISLILGIAIWLGNTGFAHAAEPQQKVYYFLHDHLGGINAVTDEQGNVVERRDYLPFGEDLMDEADATDYGFTGKERDPETDLYYYGARYYDPVTGRFISQDPVLFNEAEKENKTIENALSNPQNLNPYSYVNNNPINNIDPNGENPVAAAIEFGVVFLYTYFTTRDIAYSPDEALNTQIAQNSAPYQQNKSDIISSYAKAKLGISGIKDMKSGSKIISGGIKAGSNENITPSEALSAVAQIIKGQTKSTFGFTDVMRAVFDKNAEKPIQNIIFDALKDRLNSKPETIKKPSIPTQPASSPKINSQIQEQKEYKDSWNKSK